MTGAGMVLASAALAAEESNNEVWTIVVWVIAGLSFVVTGIGMRLWR